MLKYLLLTIAFMFLSSGVLVAGFMDAYDTFGYNIFWLLLPMTALFISAVIVNDRILIPCLLLKNRFVGYCVAVFGVVYVLTLISLYLNMPQETHLAYLCVLPITSVHGFLLTRWEMDSCWQ